MTKESQTRFGSCHNNMNSEFICATRRVSQNPITDLLSPVVFVVNPPVISVGEDLCRVDLVLGAKYVLLVLTKPCVCQRFC